MVGYPGRAGTLKYTQQGHGELEPTPDDARKNLQILITKLLLDQPIPWFSSLHNIFLSNNFPFH